MAAAMVGGSRSLLKRKAAQGSIPVSDVSSSRTHCDFLSQCGDDDTVNLPDMQFASPNFSKPPVFLCIAGQTLWGLGCELSVEAAPVAVPCSH